MRYQKVEVLLVLVSTGSGVQALYKWSECKQRVLQIQRGELAIGSVNNETLHQFIYDGPVTGLDKSYPRDQYLAVTYEGILSFPSYT